MRTAAFTLARHHGVLENLLQHAREHLSVQLVDALEAACRALQPTEPGCPLSEGWDLFSMGFEHRMHIERDDELALFPGDVAAREHIEDCTHCQAKLGRRLLEEAPAGEITTQWEDNT